MRASLLSLVFLFAACEMTPMAETDSGPDPEDAGVMMGSDSGPGSDSGAPGGDSGAPGGDSGADAGPPMGATCPPTGPYGTAAGDIAADITLMDCDGVEHTLHELCDHEAVWLFEFADWCPPCRAFASRDANRVYDHFAGPDFAAYMIISEDSAFGTIDATECAEIRERYDIHMTVLFDPSGAFQRNFSVPSNEVNVVMSRGARVEWVGQYAANMVESRIESVLEP